MFFRVYSYIDNSITYSEKPDLDIFYKVGLAFAAFARDLDDFDVDKLKNTLDKFHDTRERYKQFESSVKAGIPDRVKNAQKEVDFAREHSYIKDFILNYIDSGEVPIRVTHNDTKLNNILIDSKTNQTLAVIDLDTVMPGSILYDFGDSIRFGCNSGLEDDENLDNVNFDIEYYRVYLKAYIEVLSKHLKSKEIELLPISGVVMTYECGIRFLSDYLKGDIYFRTEREEHNLQRARVQFKLVEQMLDKQEEMKDILKEFI